MDFSQAIPHDEAGPPCFPDFLGRRTGISRKIRNVSRRIRDGKDRSEEYMVQESGEQASVRTTHSENVLWKFW
jgi:hypothetical protein